MFETTFPTGSQQDAEFAPETGGELRAFDWAELCARITATGELRRVVVAARSNGGFGNFAAQHDGPLTDEADYEHAGKRDGNHDASMNGKAGAASVAEPNNASFDLAPSGDRKTP